MLHAHSCGAGSLQRRRLTHPQRGRPGHEVCGVERKLAWWSTDMLVPAGTSSSRTAPPRSANSRACRVSMCTSYGAAMTVSVSSLSTDAERAAGSAFRQSATPGITTAAPFRPAASVAIGHHCEAWVTARSCRCERQVHLTAVLAEMGRHCSTAAASSQSRWCKCVPHHAGCAS